MILDCHHVDITHIVEMRAVNRADRKALNRRRYVRHYRRGRR